MKVVIVTQYYPPEPVPIPHAVAHGLAERGHDVRVLTGFPNYPEGRLYDGFRQAHRHQTMDGAVTIRRVPTFVSHSHNAWGRIANYCSFALSSLLAARFVRDAQVVYVYATPMTAAGGPSWWSRTRGIPFVLHIQDLWPESVTGSSMSGGSGTRRAVAAVLAPWLRRVYRRAAAVIAIGPGMAALLRDRGVPTAALHTVFNWADGDEKRARPARSATSENAQSLNILYAGNMGELQDLTTVLRAAALVSDLLGLHIDLIGSGIAEADLKELAARLNLQNVTFHDRVPYSEMSAHYSKSDFQLVPLKGLAIFRATIPSKFQASLASGIPVITTVTGDVAEIVEDNGLGLSSPPGDAEALASSFRIAYSMSPLERQEMGERAQQYYAESMSKMSGLDAIEQILLQVAEPERRKKTNARQL